MHGAHREIYVRFMRSGKRTLAWYLCNSDNVVQRRQYCMRKKCSSVHKEIGQNEVQIYAIVCTRFYLGINKSDPKSPQQKCKILSSSSTVAVHKMKTSSIIVYVSTKLASKTKKLRPNKENYISNASR